MSPPCSGTLTKRLLQRLLVDVGEVHVVELHAADLLQLLLDPAAGLQRVLQAAADRLLVVVAGGIQQLQQPGRGAPHGDGVALVQVAAELEPAVDGVGEVALAHLAHELGQIVGDQAVLVGEELRAHLRHLPAGDVGVEAIEEGGVDHALRERRQQVAGLHQRVHRLVDVADEDHAGGGLDRHPCRGRRSRRP